MKSLVVEETTFLKRINWKFILIIFILHMFGLINLWSALHDVDARILDFQLDKKFVSQIIWLALGWVVFIFATLY